LLTKRHLSYGACALAIGLTAAACSSSSKSATSSTTAATSATTAGSTGATTGSTSPSSAAAATGAPIKVGLICACSGAFGSALSTWSQTYTAWVDSVNASGGINGHPVKITFKDDGGNPATSASDVQTLIAGGVDAIVSATVFEPAWASAVEAAKVPVVGADQSSTPYYTNPDFYIPAQTGDSAAAAIAASAKASGATSMGSLYCAEAPQCSELNNPIKTAAAADGVPFSYTASIAMTAPNYTAQCLAAEQGHIGALFIGDSNVTVARVAQDCVRQGYKPAYLVEGQGFANNYISNPAISANLWSEMPDIPFTSNIPAVQAMNAAVDKYEPGLRQNINWSEGDLITWTSGELLEAAVKAGGLTASGTPSAAEITQGLESMHNETLNGLAPPFTFTAGQPHHNDCWFLVHVSNGVASTVNNGQVTCENGSATS
jgi:branched-chain amino acid transport system substrate-binding protein